MTLEIPQQMPTLTTITGRFDLVPLSAEHYEDIAHILEDDRIWAQGFGNDAHRPTTYGECLSFIDSYILANNRIIWAVIDNESGRVIGTTGIAKIFPEVKRYQIGRTIVAPEWWGPKKVNHEVKLTFIDWLFETGAARVECWVDAFNYRSERSLLSFGFTSEGVTRKSSQLPCGAWRNIQTFSILDDEWETIKVNRGIELLDMFDPSLQPATPVTKTLELA